MLQVTTPTTGMRQRQRRRRRFVAIAFLGLMLAGAAWGGRGMLRHWSQAQPRQGLAEVTRLFEAGEPERGFRLLVKLSQKSPNHPGILRELARHCEELPGHAADALVYWQQLAATGGAGDEDKVALAAALVKTGDEKAAQATLDSASESSRGMVRHAEVQAAILQLEGRGLEADRLLAETWGRTRDQPGSRLKLARMEIESAIADVRTEAGRTLWELARQPGQLAIEALDALSTAALNPAEVEEIINLVSARTDIALGLRFKILGSCLKQVPSLQTRVVEAESARTARLSLDKSGEFYEWLASLGFNRVILDRLEEHPKNEPAKPREAVLMSRKLFIAYCDALNATGRKEDLGKLLSRPGLPLNRIDLELMLALAARGGEVPGSSADAHLANALTLARSAREPSELLRVAELGERINRFSIALAAYGTLATDRRFQFDSLVRIFRLQRQQRDPEGMLRTARSIVAIKPELPAYVDEALYLSLLTGRGIEEASEILTTESGAPLTPLRRLATVLALSYAGDSNRARALLPHCQPRDLSAGPRAVLAGLLAESGNPAEAFRIAEKIPRAALSTDELWFHRMAVR